MPYLNRPSRGGCLCRAALAWMMLAWLACPAPAAHAAEAPLEAADRTCLFLDDHFIAGQAGLKRAWHQGKPLKKPAVEPTEKWEHWPCLWGSCFYDPVGKIYRMYYQSTLYPSGEKGVSFRDLVCYAESKDGRTWVKPKLGLVSFGGSKENNIVLDYAGVANAFVDPQEKDPKARLKMFVYVLKGSEQTGGQSDYCCLKSADGVRWSLAGRVEKPGFARAEEGGYVDGFQVGWDPLRERYLGNFRTFSKHKVAESKDGRRRAVGITTSKGLLKGWSPAATVVRPDEEDDRKAAAFGKDPKAPDWAELYTMPMWNYGNHYLGLVTLFCLVDGKDGNGGGDLQLCFSNDGQTWHRTPGRQSAIARSGEEGLFPCFAQFNPPLDMGDEVWAFYSENNGVHGVQPFSKSAGKVRAAAWRKDGFASLATDGKGGLITKTLTFSGKQLRLNLRTAEGGSARVAVLDGAGEPVPGLGLDDCDPLRGDSVSKAVTWRGKSDLSRLAGKPVRLRVELSACRLWSFRFAP